MALHYIRCIDIQPDPRSTGYEPHQLEELAASIRQCGILRPILLRKIVGGYVLVHGERRWRAALSIGLNAIPAIIVEDAHPAEHPALPVPRRPRAFSMFPVPSPANTVFDYADWDE